ncbi:MAG TPA: hypothetical protein VK395_29160 [Gemmataceae bacterium]|nr:hypothetical protein [Gemmataceae bacterium]
MPNFYHSHPGETVYSLISQFEQFPPGCDPDFDNDLQEIERQLAEIRMTHDRN